jgi:hypothetical protein
VWGGGRGPSSRLSREQFMSAAKPNIKVENLKEVIKEIQFNEEKA